MEIMPYVIGSLIALVAGTVLGSVLPAILIRILIGACSLFLICLVLIQRGRGGGLAGAFGAAGGSSAFGTRAGDVFTRITIVTASTWIALNMGLVINTNERVRAAQQSNLGAEFRPDDAGESGRGGETAPPAETGAPTGRDLVPTPADDAEPQPAADAEPEPAAPR